MNKIKKEDELLYLFISKKFRGIRDGLAPIKFNKK